MPKENNASLADLEKQVGDLENQLKKAMVESDNVPDNPLGKPKKLKKPKPSLHDNRATSAMDKAKKKSMDDGNDDDEDDDMDKALQIVEKALAKAKKKSSDDNDNEDDDDEIDKALEALNVIKAKKKSSEDDDDVEDNWSEEADKKKMKKASSRMMPGMMGRKKPMKKNLEQPASFESDGESLMFDGQHIAKADVGEQQFNIIKSMSARIAKAETDRQMAELRKRADDEYAHIPGTTDERAAMLKAIGSLPESEQQAFEKVLRAHEKMAKSAFQGIGVSRLMPDTQKSGNDFIAKVNEIRARDTVIKGNVVVKECSQSEAMTRARQEHPDLFKAYQGN